MKQRRTVLVAVLLILGIAFIKVSLYLTLFGVQSFSDILILDQVILTADINSAIATIVMFEILHILFFALIADEFDDYDGATYAIPLTSLLVLVLSILFAVYFKIFIKR